MGLMVLLLLVAVWCVGLGCGLVLRTTGAAVAQSKTRSELRARREQSRTLARLVRQHYEMDSNLATIILDEIDKTEREIES